MSALREQFISENRMKGAKPIKTELNIRFKNLMVFFLLIIIASIVSGQGADNHLNGSTLIRFDETMNKSMTLH